MSNEYPGRAARAAAICADPEAYVQDGLASTHDHRFMQDPAFRAAYERGIAAAGRDYHWHWRVHIGLWAADVAMAVEGDFVECGVNAGFLSSAIMQHLDWNTRQRRFFLLDTFGGIDRNKASAEELAEGIMEKNQAQLDNGFYVTDVEKVRRNFAEWRNVEIIAGSIPDTLGHVGTERIAFLHIDLNCAPPEVAALAHFWPRLSKGAIVLLDDYAYHGYHLQKAAMDTLAAQLGVAIASLPTGQGLLIRP